MMLGLTQQEFWGSVIVLCVIGLFYFGSSVIAAEMAEEKRKPFRWGDGQRHPTDAPLWASHPLLAAFTCLLVLFVLKLALG